MPCMHSCICQRQCFFISLRQCPWLLLTEIISQMKRKEANALIKCSHPRRPQISMLFLAQTSVRRSRFRGNNSQMERHISSTLILGGAGEPIRCIPNVKLVGTKVRALRVWILFAKLFPSTVSINGHNFSPLKHDSSVRPQTLVM